MLVAATLLTSCDTAQAFFMLQISGFAPGTALPRDYQSNRNGCRGLNMSPPLRWSNPPSATRFFAITEHRASRGDTDPDLLWLVLAIPGNVRMLPYGAGSMLNSPANVGGASRYRAWCPAAGDTEAIVFTVHALRDTVDVRARYGSLSELRAAIADVRIDSASVTAYVHR